MSRAVLFNSPINFRGYKDVFEITPIFIRYGTVSIAGFLRKNDIEVKIVDPFLISPKTVKKIIQQFSPKFVGISPFSNEIVNASKTMEYVKKINSEITTIIGNCHVSALPIETMQTFKSFDIGVLGEGEITMLEIVTGKKLTEIKGIIYRDDENLKVTPEREPIKDLSILGPPAFDLYNLYRYKEKISFSGTRVLNLPIEFARGCPYSCIFCFRSVGRNMRYKEPVQVADELEHYIERYSAKRVHFIDGTFGVNRKLTLELCKEIIKRGINKKVKWHASVRADTLDEEMVEAFASSGCRILGLGAESGDNKVLDLCKKGTSRENISNTVKLGKKYKIFVEAYFIFGLPGDTAETIENTIKFAKELDIDSANFAILVPFPGTKIFDWAEKGEMGYKFATRDYRFFGKQSGCALKNERIDSETLIALQNKAYRVFYSSNFKRFTRFLYHLNFKRMKGIINRYKDSAEYPQKIIRLQNKFRQGKV